MLTVQHVPHALFLGICVLFCSGFVVPPPPSVEIPHLQFGKKLPIEAALLVTEETRSRILKGDNPELRISLIVQEILLGDALEKISLELFSQIFDKITLVRTPEEAKKYKLFVEPKVIDFQSRVFYKEHFGKFIIHTRVGSYDRDLKVVIYSPLGYQRGAISAALVYSLGTVAVQIGEDAAVRKIIER